MPDEQHRPTSPAGFTTAAGWVSAVLGHARPHGTPPRYGSPEHLRLSPSDPLFVAAVAIAAHAWYTEHGTPEIVAERLHLELALTDQAEDANDREDFAEMAASVRRMAATPTIAELADRRGQPARAARARAHAAAMRDGWNDPPGGTA